MTSSPHSVALVLDPKFGENLVELSSRLHVWVVDSPENNSVAETVWQNQSVPHSSIELGITTFLVDQGLGPSDWCIGVLGSIDLHHGEYSHDPALSAIEVYGLPFNESLRSHFSEIGLTSITATAYGFYAASPAA